MAKNPKKKKVVLKDTPIELRHIGVALESIDKKIDTLVDGHHAHEKRFNRLEKKVDGIKLEMDHKFNIAFEELHLIRSEQVKRAEFTLLEKRVLALEKKKIH